MGYFQKRIDRGRAREMLRRRAEWGERARPWEAIPSEPPTQICYVRFAILEIHAESRRRTGIFHAISRVEKHNRGDAQLEADIERALDWFTVNLHAPSLADERAVFLFKTSARECMRRAWELIGCLRRGGAIVEMQTVEKPGKILYEDELQVAVVPWADADLV